MYGRNFIGYDLNPFAIFLASNSLEIGFNQEIFDLEFNKIEESVKTKIMNLYKVKENYLLYTVLGPKNKKTYNAVISDINFKNKQKVSVTVDVLNPKVVFPKTLTFPDREFPEQFYKDRFSYKGVKKVSDMFSKRNLLALAILFNEIEKSKFKYKDLLTLAFTNTILHVSKLKAEEVRPLSVNNYWIPDDYIEENVWWRFADRAANIRKAKFSVIDRKSKTNNHSAKFTLHNKSSLKMDSVKSKSVDYVFTDPPYGDAIQYSELSYMWNTWLSKHFNNKDEVIINPVQKKGVNEFNDQISLFIKETDRVLKDGGFFTLCFQNKDPEIWIKIIKQIRSSRFKLLDISSFDTFGSPYNKSWAKFSPKSDFYITFQKSEESPLNTKGKMITPEDIANEIVSFLSKKGKSRDNLINLNKGYDLFVGIVINKIFDGYEITDTSRLTVENIISTLQSTSKKIWI